ncbi:MAG TPA: CDP-alcohol phosphatidyltransferase family protein, partial [Thermomicrobiales bacterium]|nr:CDP-alcohol phosphatidyltransferase family protein [Thermomicrobiales bacterium]
MNAAALALALPPIAWSGGKRASVRAMIVFAVCATVQRVGIAALRRRTASPPGAADPMTLSRAASGTLLLSLAAAGTRRTDPAARLGFVAASLGATAADWLDGPIARRRCATVAGAVLDIEADSWLTLTTAIAAVRWGGLAPWTLLPPALRYLDPIAARRQGGWFIGGGSWWSRATGAAQMALLLAAIAPIDRPRLTRLLRRVGLAIAAAQLAVQATRRVGESVSTLYPHRPSTAARSGWREAAIPPRGPRRRRRRR